MFSRLWLAGTRVAQDLTGRSLCPVGTLANHQAAAIEWLCRAQDATPDGGVSAGYHLKDGWLPSYAETTGYIACTFFDLGSAKRRSDLETRAWGMTDWLLTQQLDSGGFPGQFGQRCHGPIVFNTGQVLLGLVRACECDPARSDVRAAAIRAAHWLTSMMDPDGCWRRCTHAGAAHAYNTRTAWALLRCYGLCGDDALRAAAVRNLRWALGTQHADGYFDHAGFREGVPPPLHTIAYVIRGLLEAGAMLDDHGCLESATRAAHVLAGRMNECGSLAGVYEAGWKPAARYRCLTGEAQMAVIWARLYGRTGEECFRRACARAVRFVTSTQTLVGPDCVRGAIAGSYPIWGAYSRFEFPNWAAKFFVDAIAAYEGLESGVPASKEEALCV